jgi:hypothetical protein
MRSPESMCEQTYHLRHLSLWSDLGSIPDDFGREASMVVGQEQSVSYVHLYKIIRVFVTLFALTRNSTHILDQNIKEKIPWQQSQTRPVRMKRATGSHLYYTSTYEFKDQVSFNQEAWCWDLIGLSQK